MDNAGLNFGKAGGLYAQYRPVYPSFLFGLLLKRAPTPRVQAADLGAGTGLSANALAGHFKKVIAVEPDAHMLAAGRFAPNVEAQNCAAHKAAMAAGSCQLVTCANAFYWMDGPTVLQKAAAWLCPGGLFAAYRYSFPHVLNQQAAQILQRRLHGHWWAHFHPRLQNTGYTQRAVNQCGLFKSTQLVLVPNRVPLTAAQLAGFFASTSYVGAYLAGHKHPTRYLQQLKQALQKAAQGQPLVVDFSLELVMAQLP